MKVILKVLLALIYYSIIHHCFSLCQAQTLIDEYISSSRLVDEFRNNVESRFLSGEIEKIIDAFPFSEREKGAYMAWFKQKIRMKDSYSIDSINCMLPILGYDSNRALIQNGCFSIWFSDQDTSFHEFVRFREFVLNREADSVLSCTFESVPSGEYSKVVIKESDFDVVISPLDKSLRVVAEFKIAAPEGELPSEISLFFRYPISVNNISCDRQELQGEHIFTRFAALPVHQCIVKLPPSAERGARSIKLDYSLNYTNHSLSRKQVGFTDDNGYIVLEAGWYPWFENSFNTIPANLSISVPENITAIAPGLLVDISSSGNGVEKFSYSCRQETWPFIVWGNYKMLKSSEKNSQVEYYLKSQGNINQEKLDSVYREIYNVLGEIFPDPEFDYQRIIEVSRHGGYGPTGNLLIDGSYLTDKNLCSPETIELLAHELTHSWVNSLNTPAGKYGSFLSEGLATFMGAEVVRKLLGEFEAYKLWARNYAAYLSIRNKAPAPADLTEELMFTSNDIYRGVVYYKGAYFFKILNELAGESGFKRLMTDMTTSAKGDFTIERFTDICTQIDREAYSDLFGRFLSDAYFPEDNFLKSYTDKYLSDSDKEQMTGLLDSAFYYLVNNSPDILLSLFSDDTDLVPLNMKDQIRKIAENWNFEIAVNKNRDFLVVDNTQFDLLCYVELCSSEAKTDMPVTVRLVKEDGWRLVKIKFGQ